MWSRSLATDLYSSQMVDQRSLTSATNGAQSIGPTSPEGKARSGRNAEKHGMYSSAIVLQNESHEDFAILRDSYYQRFRPADQPETDLVDQMVAATWRQRRLGAIESAAYDHAMDAQRAGLDATYPDLDSATRNFFALKKLDADSAALNSCQRFQAAQIRQYDRAFRNLRFLQSEKKPVVDIEK